MRDLEGKTAFVTGGASGLGFAMAQAFARHGMQVMIADIDAEPLQQAVKTLRGGGAKAEAVLCDVSDRKAVAAASQKTLAAFGKVHVVCNNAGVAAAGPIGTIRESDWDWVIAVNLKGVVNGMEVFTPLIERHGEGGHFVNTASLAGMLAFPTAEPYIATKFAVVGMSEGWAAQLAPKNIGVSVLCPGYVRTRIAESERARPDRFGGAVHMSATERLTNPGVLAVQSGIPAGPVAERVVEAIRDNDFYIFTHVEYRDIVEARMKNILAAFDKSAASPALAKLPKRELNLGLPE